MLEKNTNRDEIANKLAIVNKIIKKGYDNALNSISNTGRDYCLSIRNNNFFLIREQLMSELYPLVQGR
jgi:hypothetical protein